MRERAGKSRAHGASARTATRARARARADLLAPLDEAAERLDEVTAHRAARAAVVHRDEVLLRLQLVGDELLVDVDLAELVLDDADALLALLHEDVVDQRRLAGAEEARDDRERRLVRLAMRGRNAARRDGWGGGAADAARRNTFEFFDSQG